MNAIVILVRSELQDIEDLNLCLNSLQEHLFSTLSDSDLLIFHEANFDLFRKSIKIPKNFPSLVKFIEVSLDVPQEQKNNFGKRIKEFYPHPTHGNGPVGFGHPGFSLGYRSMCRFFAGTIFRHDVFKNSNYKYLLRLDTDSLFLSGHNISLFSWAESFNLKYSYIASAIQWDHKNVSKFLKLYSLGYFARINLTFFLKCLFVPRGKIFYTNFEICEINYFSSPDWQNYFNDMDSRGGFYLYRWGDALVRYMGLKVLLDRKFRKPIPPGFVYKHGGIFHSEHKKKYRPRWLRRV
jgi:hypothetical protein